MTNEEAIRILEDITWNSNRRYEVTDMLDTRNLSIQALQENTKLKAEIEQLKSELEQSNSRIKDKIIARRWEFASDTNPIEAMGE